ncbi:TPA: tyrosine-type recombinase/integrase [Vibrio parahaemolyticus]|nr:tyrosine-type recombinase/integrase [Vibrio parahaemolyticus]
MTVGKSNKPLSDRAIRNHKADGKTLVDVGEYRGLRVNVGKTGRKTFTYRYRSPVNNKITQAKLGTYPDMSLEQARVELKHLKAIRDAGKCPKRELEKQKLLETQAKESDRYAKINVKNLVDNYLKGYIEGSSNRKPKGQKEARRTLYKDVVKPIGSKLAIDLTRKDISDLVMGIVERGANVQAGYVLRELTSAYRYAISTGYLPYEFVNPALQAKDSLKISKVKLTCSKGRRYFNDEEIVQFLNWLPISGFSQNQKGILRLTLWTGCRTGEVCSLAWSDVNLNNKTLFLRETKTGLVRHVMLSNQAAEWLQNKYQKRDKNDYVFQSQRTRRPVQQKHLSEKICSLKQKGMMLDIPNWTPHDLRRTVRTGLARKKCPSEVAEAVLGHTKEGINGTYDLHSYEDECRVWLQKWADHLDSLMSESIS